MAPKKDTSKKDKDPKAKDAKKGGAASAKAGGGGAEGSGEVSAADMLRNDGVIATCALSSKKMHANVRDISVSALTVLLHGTPLIDEAEFSLNYGNRYGLIGRNGCGKSTFMRVIGARCLPIPDGIDIYHVCEEIEASDMTAKQAVMSVDVERAKLEEEAEQMNDAMVSVDEGSEEADQIQDRLVQIYERLEELDATTAEVRASKILSGLGFTPASQSKKTREFSGGWRMRIALARALFIQPTLLLLDEPTNHLDMEAVVWLEDYLSKWNKILLLVSHSQDFLNHVCTHMINFTHKKLVYYTGNYDTFVKTKTEKEVEQQKIYDREQEQIQHMKEYVARFGQGNAKMARQAQSKEKVLDKMVKGGLTEKVEIEKPMDFKFADPSPLSPPVLMCNDITFGYPGREILYRNVDFGIDLDSRVALVGPNGAGKSTLLKIMTGDLVPLTGEVRPHPHLRISKFSQHFIDVLDLAQTPLDYFMKTFDLPREDCRKYLGRFGVSGVCQTQVMGQLSDGQKSRVVLAKIAKENPHILFLDEPTNHLDMESIDSLAKAINLFTGGLVLVSHDMRLISQVAKEIWLCDHCTIQKFVGEINDFKMQLRNQMQKGGLMDGDSKSMAKCPEPKFVPITPVTRYSNTSKDIPMIAPLAPVKASVSTLTKEGLKLNKEKEAKDALLYGALPPQPPGADGAAKGGDLNELGETEEEAKARKEKEKDIAKEKKKAEKAAAEELSKRMEQERIERQKEKLEEIEAAKRLKEEKLKAAEEDRDRERRKAAEEQAEKDVERAKLQEWMNQKKAEREAKKKAKIDAKIQEDRDTMTAIADALAKSPWSQVEQTKFERAVLTNTTMLEKVERWTNIAAAVPGKTVNECIVRYKYLKEYFALKKKLEDIPLNYYVTKM